MKRKTRSPGPPQPPAVEKIELNDTNWKKRLLVAALFLALGAAAITYSISLLLRQEPGWRQVNAVGSDLSCAEDFTLTYYVSGKTENRDLSALYGQAAQTAYRLFTADVEYDGLNNVATLNRRPNEALELNEVLYDALSFAEEAGLREIFLAPAARLFEGIWQAGDDAYAAQMDPWESEDLAAYFAQIAAYARDPASVSLELLEGNRVRLNVSEAYLRFAEENGIDRFIDFGWMKNAFIADYLADTFLEQGYTAGFLSSYDGFSRSLSPESGAYAMGIFRWEEDHAVQVAQLAYGGPMAAVSLRDFPLTEGDGQRFYRYADGQRRCPYLSLADGRCYAALDALTATSRRLSCRELLAELIPVYVREDFDPQALLALRESGLEALWCEGDTLWYTDPSLAEGGLELGPEPLCTAKLAQ